MGQTRPLSVFFVLSRHKYSTNLAINYKNIDGVLVTRTQGGRMVGVDESTGLWRHPNLIALRRNQYNNNTVRTSIWIRPGPDVINKFNEGNPNCDEITYSDWMVRPILVTYFNKSKCFFLFSTAMLAWNLLMTLAPVSIKFRVTTSSRKLPLLYIFVYNLLLVELTYLPTLACRYFRGMKAKICQLTTVVNLINSLR